jgi:hypothetical protein
MNKDENFLEISFKKGMVIYYDSLHGLIRCKLSEWEKDAAGYRKIKGVVTKKTESYNEGSFIESSCCYFIPAKAVRRKKKYHPTIKRFRWVEAVRTNEKKCNWKTYQSHLKKESSVTI